MRAELDLPDDVEPVAAFDSRDGVIAPSYDPERLLQIACGRPEGWAQQRAALVAEVRARFRDGCGPIDGRCIEAALAAMADVPRERFVPPEFARLAYLPMSGDIGCGQTISNPHLVAVMTAAILPGLPGLRSTVLDVGTGSGYQAAVLAGLAARVVSTEILPDLAEPARRRLGDLGYGNVEVVCGDGVVATARRAPFDGIVIAAGAAAVPRPLLDQLAVGGRLVMPVGPAGAERLTLVERGEDRLRWIEVGKARFVPLTGSFGRINEAIADEPPHRG